MKQTVGLLFVCFRPTRLLSNYVSLASLNCSCNLFTLPITSFSGGVCLLVIIAPVYPFLSDTKHCLFSQAFGGTIDAIDARPGTAHCRAQIDESAHKLLCIAQRLVAGSRLDNEEPMLLVTIVRAYLNISLLGFTFICPLLWPRQHDHYLVVLICRLSLSLSLLLLSFLHLSAI